MKRWGLIVVTTLTVLVTGFVLTGASRGHHRANRHSGPTLRTAPRESLAPAVALRQAQCQANSWRDCLLAR